MGLVLNQRLTREVGRRSRPGFRCYFSSCVKRHCTSGFLFPHMQCPRPDQWFSAVSWEVLEIQKGASVECMRELVVGDIWNPPALHLEQLCSRQVTRPWWCAMGSCHSELMTSHLTKFDEHWTRLSQTALLLQRSDSVQEIKKLKGNDHVTAGLFSSLGHSGLAS